MCILPAAAVEADRVVDALDDRDAFALGANRTFRISRQVEPTEISHSFHVGAAWLSELVCNKSYEIHHVCKPEELKQATP